MNTRKVMSDVRYNQDGTVSVTTIVELKTFAGWLTVRGSANTVTVLAAEAQAYLESYK